MTLSELRVLLRAHYPVIDSMFRDRALQFEERKIDMRWYYERHLDISVCGFNPFVGRIYFGRQSFLSKFLFDSDACVDQSDWYLYEVFFAAHDYVHAWCVRELTHRLDVRVTKKSLRDAAHLKRFLYMLLLSEAAATVAVDYWLLCQKSVNDLLSGRGTFHALTTTYRNADLKPIRRKIPEFDVGSKSFFWMLAEAYCTGSFGVLAPFVFDAANSPESWLSIEKCQTGKQQILAHGWLRFLSGRRGRFVDTQLTKEEFLSFAEATGHICDRLWRCCFGGDPLALAGPAQEETLSPLSEGVMDFRFVNARDVPHLRRHVVGLRDAVQWKYFLAQYISCFDYDHFSSRARGLLCKSNSAAEVERITGCRIGEGLSTEGFFNLLIPN
jgi:hypothetical protein